MTLKLKRTPGLYLVGFMATGKSTVGKALAGELGWVFRDIDAEIEKEQGASISEIFSTRGEPEFRQIETSVIRRHVDEIRAGIPSVLALGGGAYVQSGNRDLLQNNGVTVWLDCPFEVVCQRLNGDNTRPLATDLARLAKLYEARRPLYGGADYHVEASTDNVDLIVQAIRELPIF